MRKTAQSRHQPWYIAIKRPVLIVGVLVAALSLTFCILLAYIWFIERPSSYERDYIRPINDAMTYSRPPFLLKDVLPWPWDKACVVHQPDELGVNVDMSRASREIIASDNTSSILVFFYKDQQPWGIRITDIYLPHVKHGECIDSHYLFSSK